MRHLVPMLYLMVSLSLVAGGGYAVAHFPDATTFKWVVAIGLLMLVCFGWRNNDGDEKEG